jgi:predicted ATPase
MVQILVQIGVRRGSYRSADVVVRGHPLRRLVQELHGHGQCEEVTLELLSEEEVQEYLRRRFPGSPAILLLSPAIYSRTDGNALFTVNFMDYLVQQGLTVEANGQWEVRAETSTIKSLVPGTVQRLIEHVPDPVYALQLHTHLGTAGTFRGTHAQAQAHHAQALSLYNPEAHRSLVFSAGGDPKAIINAISAWSLCLSGWPEQAWNRAERGLVHAEEISPSFSLTVALLHAIHVRQFRGELGEAWKLTQRMTFLAREHGFAFYVPVGAATQGCVLVQRGELEEGLALLTTGLAQYRAMGSQLFLPFFLGFLAEAYERQGKAEEGLKVVAEALRLTETNFDRFWEAEAYRLKGQLTPRKFQVQSSKFRVPPNTRPQTPNTHEAEACFLHALAVARQQGAKALELRAAMSLARLWRRQSRKTEARHLLAEIYGWFTEGFDTADLQEAQTLLAELS